MSRAGTVLPGRRSGFSLLEILVVVSTGVLLAGAVLSAGRILQVKSRQAVSAGHLRQWGSAMGLHAADNSGKLPRRGQGRQKLTALDRPEDWFNALPPSLGQPFYQDLVAKGRTPRPGDDSVFICPGVKSDAGHALGYGMNMNLSPWNFPEPTLLSRIASPSTVVFMAEASGDYSSVYPSVAG